MAVKSPQYILDMEAKFDILFNNFKNLALNIFEWKNLPKGIKSEYIEKKLFEKGSLFFYNSKKAGGIMCLPADNSSNYNVYNYPEKMRIQGHNFTDQAKFEDGVLIKNNPLKTPTFDMVSFWTKHIVDIFSAFKVNLNHSKTPYVLSGTKEQMLSLKNILEQVTGNSIAVYIDKSLSDLASIDLKQTGVQFIGDKLLDAYDRIEDKLLTFLGINNSNTNKRERLVVDEVNSNNDEIENSLDVFYTARKKAVEEINEMFASELEKPIEVTINQNYVKLMKTTEQVEKDNTEEIEQSGVNENE